MSLRHRLSPFVVLLLAALLFIPARSQDPQSRNAEERIVDVDYTADLMRLVKVGDSMVMSLVGHVVLHHNGAVITCDSAIRYDERMMDCFRNVIINQDSTFVYGDRAEYNGRTNLATVFSPIVKMVDKDAVFYTYNFTFNTLDNIGHYYGGGTLLQNENRMESDEGYYYVDDRTMVGIGNVEMENPDYKMQSDSVRYNMNTEVAQFFTRSYIWNSKDEFLTALQGEYDRPNEKYTFVNQSYVLTGTQEIWADTLIYVQGTGDALLINNAQIVDEEHQLMAFGDYVRYWGEERKALLTRRPVVASFEEAPDTLFMRADSMFLYTYNRYDTIPAIDSTALSIADSVANESFSEYPDLPDADHMERESSDGLEVEEATVESELEADHDHAPGEEHDHDHDGDGIPDHDEPQLTAKELKAAQKERERQAKQEARAKKEAAAEAKKQVKLEAKEKARAEKQAARDEKLRRRLEKRRAALTELEREALRLDSTKKADSLARLDSLALIDSLALVDSLVLDSLALLPGADSLALAAADSTKADSLQRKLFAYHNVKIFRSDFQAICDSMTGFTIDSTIHMYIDPILWNENNQIKSQEVEVQTRNQMIEKAIFTGDPIMASEVDSAHYNQIKGKIIEAYFREGEVYRTDVNGNGQTYYYMEDGDSTDRYISGFMTVESADISFYFENREIVLITWRNQPEYVVYPMDKIPEGQEVVLPGFTWEIHRRPEQADVFDRVLRPSEREFYEALEKPLYPITDKINKERERLTKSGVWFDRTDQLSNEAVEFMRTLRR